MDDSKFEKPESILDPLTDDALYAHLPEDLRRTAQWNELKKQKLLLKQLETLKKGFLKMEPDEAVASRAAYLILADTINKDQQLIQAYLAAVAPLIEGLSGAERAKVLDEFSARWDTEHPAQIDSDEAVEERILSALARARAKSAND